MYELIMWIVGSLGVSLIVSYFLLVVANWAFGWVKDESRPMFGYDLLRKWGILAGYEDATTIIGKSIMLIVFIILGAIAWPITITTLFVIAGLHGVRGFYRFKTKVNNALIIEKE